MEGSHIHDTGVHPINDYIFRGFFLDLNYTYSYYAQSCTVVLTHPFIKAHSNLHFTMYITRISSFHSSINLIGIKHYFFVPRRKFTGFLISSLEIFFFFCMVIQNKLYPKFTYMQLINTEVYVKCVSKVI